jgi:N-carbamoylputrescine amidase
MTTMSAVAANFGRDLEECFAGVAAHIAAARERGVELLVLPEATLGGYLSDLSGAAALPPALDGDGPEIRRLVELAGDMVVTAGYCESDAGQRFNSAVCVGGGEVLGNHRKVHQPLGEGASYSAGEHWEAFDTPIGRLGMMICYDKAFPEAARTLAIDGAAIIACMSAWPAARTDPTPDTDDDRWRHRFDLYDRARALENQVVWVSANQCGTFGSLRFVGHAKVVGPGGDVLADTGRDAGVATADVDVAAELKAARAHMFMLRDRRAETYGREVSV